MGSKDKIRTGHLEKIGAPFWVDVCFLMIVAICRGFRPYCM